jgi:hypothetical protein
MRVYDLWPWIDAIVASTGFLKQIGCHELNGEKVHIFNNVKTKLAKKS